MNTPKGAPQASQLTASGRLIKVHCGHVLLMAEKLRSDATRKMNFCVDDKFMDSGNNVRSDNRTNFDDGQQPQNDDTLFC